MEWTLAGITLLFGIIGWLLVDKDKKQGIDINQLYQLHHSNEAKISLFELEVAKNHYTQPQVDFKFQQLDNTMRDGFKDLGTDIREMTKSLNAHLMEKE